ncbi:MAG: carboxypeptidase regulatory-like domain-containing protein [Gemmatimonadales bacterium]
MTQRINPSPRRTFVTVLLAAASLGLSQTTLLDAQTVKGRLLDHASGKPIPDASVALLTQSGAVVKIAIADSTGAYSVRTPRSGTYSFRVDARGYNTLNGLPFTVRKGQTLELNMQLWSLTELPAVVVTADSLPLAPGPLRGFYDRVERGLGHYVTRKDIEKRASSQFTSLLRLVPSVRIVPSPYGQAQFTVRIKGSPCPPMLWVDNSKWGSVDFGEGIDRELFPHDLEGIEVYRPSEVPTEFSDIDSGCGVIVVWTRRGP